MRWIPQWHPVTWIIVAVIVVAVISNPVGMGHRAGSIIHEIGYAFHQITVCVENI